MRKQCHSQCLSHTETFMLRRKTPHPQLVRQRSVTHISFLCEFIYSTWLTLPMLGATEKDKTSLALISVTWIWFCTTRGPNFPSFFMLPQIVKYIELESDRNDELFPNRCTIAVVLTGENEHIQTVSNFCRKICPRNGEFEAWIVFNIWSFVLEQTYLRKWDNSRKKYYN